MLPASSAPSSPVTRRDSPSSPLPLRSLLPLITVAVILGTAVLTAVPTVLMLRQAEALRSGSLPGEEAGRRLAYHAYVFAGCGALITVVVTAVVAVAGRAAVRRANQARATALTVAQQHVPELVVRLQQGLDIDTADLPEPTGHRDEFGVITDAVARLARYALDAAYVVHRERDGFNRFCAGVAEHALVSVAALLRELDERQRQPGLDSEARDALYMLDHEIVQLRRQLENLLLLVGGAVPHPHTRPVPVGNIVIDAVGESPGLKRVQTEFGAEGWILPEAAGPLTHLLAELIDNAIAYSAPQLGVVVRSVRTSGGIAFEVEDRGNGLSDDLLTKMNSRLRTAPLFAEVADSDQLGLFVVGRLAAQLSIGVTLRPSAYGGLSAVVMVPAALLGELPRTAAEHTPAGPAAQLPQPSAALPWSASPAAPGRPADTAPSSLPDTPAPGFAEQVAPVVTESGLPRRTPGSHATGNLRARRHGGSGGAVPEDRTGGRAGAASPHVSEAPPMEQEASAVTADGLPRRTPGTHGPATPGAMGTTRDTPGHHGPETGPDGASPADGTGATREALPLPGTTSEPTSPWPTPQWPTPRWPTPQEPAPAGPMSQEPAPQEPASPGPASQGPTSQGPTSQEPTSQEPTSQEPTAVLTADGLPRRTRGAHVAAQLRADPRTVPNEAQDTAPGSPMPDPAAAHDAGERTPEQLAAQFAGFPTYIDPHEETPR